MRIGTCICAIAVLLTAGSALAAVPSSYSFTDLGDYGDYNQPSGSQPWENIARALNENGQIAGEAYATTNVPTYYREQPTADGTLPGAGVDQYTPANTDDDQNLCWDINNNGVATGQMKTSVAHWTQEFQAYRWNADGSMQTLQGPIDGSVVTTSWGRAINDAGRVAGMAMAADLNTYPVFWEAGTTTPTKVSHPDGLSASGDVFGINTSGQMVGRYQRTADPNQGSSAYITAANGTTTAWLHAPAGNVYATDINDDGVVIGKGDSLGTGWSYDYMVPWVWVPDSPNGLSSTAGLQTMPVIASPGADPNVPNYQTGNAWAINNNGLVVGMLNDSTIGTTSSYDEFEPFYHNPVMLLNYDAFLWDYQDSLASVYNLQDMLDASAPETVDLLCAMDINDDGQVLVLYRDTVTNPDYVRSALLTPVASLIPGDCDGDGDVDLTDLAILASNYGAVEPPALEHGDGDFDDDGDVDLTDLAILANNWGFGTMTAVPEPATLSIAGVGALLMLRRRRR